MIKRIAFFAALLCFWDLCAYAQEKFPFLGEVTSRHVNIRAGQNMNFEILCKLDKGQEIVVVEKSYQWYKIKLPSHASSYINAGYVRLRAGDVGVVTANRVYIRAGASEKSSVIGRANKGTRLRIKNQSQGWYKVEPLEGCFGWVAGEYVAFKSNEIPLVIANIDQTEDLNGINARQSPPGAETTQETKAVFLPQKEHKEPELFSIIGQLEDIGRMARFKDIRYKLLVGGKVVCFIQGPGKGLDEFIHQKVRIEGRIKDDLRGIYRYPVILLSSIRLME